MESRNFKRVFRHAAIIISVLMPVLTGCSGLFGAAEVEPSRVKAPAKEAIVTEIDVTRGDLKLALGNELKTTKLRAVEVFQNTSGAQQTYPSFRLFEISDGSVYALLGLSNADILVAINERVVVSPQVLTQVVRLLPNEQGVSFEVIREGKSQLIKVRFVD